MQAREAREHEERRDTPPGTGGYEPFGEDTEAFGELMRMAGRRTGHIPPELVVDKVMRVTEGGDWPLRRAAMEAVLRRLTFARRDELVVDRRPPGGRALGLYQTRRKGKGGRGNAAPRARPYRTLLCGVEPLSGSCDCPDYQRSGLGLCKHLLVVCDELGRKPRKWKRALSEQAKAEGDRGRPRLAWDPVRPLTGEGDWLARVSLRPGGGSNGRPAGGKTARAVARWFEDGNGGVHTLDPGLLADPAKRAALLDDLRRFLQAEKKAGGAGWLPSDPAIEALCRAEAARMQRAGELRKVRRGLKTALRSFRRRVYPYQLEGVERFMERGVHLLADDMGLGKTVEAIAACHVLWHRGRAARGLVVVPASLKSQWQREWQACTDVPVEVVDGPPEARAAAYRRNRKTGFLIVNYEQVLRDLPLMHRFAPDLMVLDEAQRIKNWATKTAAYIKRLKPPLRLVLTGTPMENRLEELASIMDWVDDRAIEPKWRLAPWHTVTGDGRRGAGGARNLDTLRARLAPCLTRRVRREVLDQLPERTDTRVPVPMTASQQEAHDELDLPIARLVSAARKRPLTQAEFLKLMQLLTLQRILCNGLAQRDFEHIWPGIRAVDRPDPRLLERLEAPKLIELRELVAQVVLEQRRKVVIFSQWRRMLELARWAVSDLLDDAGLRAAFFTGREDQKRRTRNVVDFHDDPAVGLLLCSDAGGVGLNLQRAASCMVCCDLPWNPAVLEQRVGRIHRLGQKEPIEVYHLVSETGIEGRIEGLIGDKKAMFTGLFDGDSDEVRFDRSSSFLSKLERIVEPVEVPELDEPAGAEDEDDEADQIFGPADEPAPGGDEDQEPATAAGAGREPGDAVEVSGQDRKEEETGEAGRAERPEKAAPSGAEVRAMLSGIQVRRTERGGIAIEAPPEAAETLASMFYGMADLLARAAGPEERP